MVILPVRVGKEWREPESLQGHLLIIMRNFQRLAPPWPKDQTPEIPCGDGVQLSVPELAVCCEGWIMMHACMHPALYARLTGMPRLDSWEDRQHYCH